MKDQEILAQFDGRGTAEFLLGGFEMMDADIVAAIGFELGYDFHHTEVLSKTVHRLTFVRNDSPDVRRRAQQTLNRLHAGGPLLPPTWMSPDTQGSLPRYVSAVEVAQARRNLTAYETNGVSGLAVIIGLISLGFLTLAWVRCDTLGAALVLLGVGVLLAVMAILTPRWLRRWHERDRELVRRYDRQRSSPGGPPPPPGPPPGPRPDGRNGHEGAGSDTGRSC